MVCVMKPKIYSKLVDNHVFSYQQFFLACLLLFSFHADTTDAFGWVENSSIVLGLPDVGAIASPVVGYNIVNQFNFNLISTSVGGSVYGFYWELFNNSWVSNISYVADIYPPSVSFISNLFYDFKGLGKTWLMFDASSNISAYYYNPSTSAWVEDNSIVTGIIPSPGNIQIIPDLTGDGSWTAYDIDYAYTWNGSSWVIDAYKREGIIDTINNNNQFSASAFNITGYGEYNYLTEPYVRLNITNNTYIGWNGQSFSKTTFPNYTWIEDETMFYGLGQFASSNDVPSFVFNLRNNGKWSLIVGRLNGTFKGFEYTPFPLVHVNLSPSIVYDDGLLVGYCNVDEVGLHNYTYKWYKDYNNTVNGSDVLVSELIAFYPYNLSVGSSYTFSCKVTYNDGNKSAFRSVYKTVLSSYINGTCFDGILNQDETYFDWGGICGYPLNFKCNNGFKDSVTNETDIDYGGVCGNCTDTGLSRNDDKWLILSNSFLITSYPFNESLCEQAEEIQGSAISFVLILSALLIIPMVFIIFILILGVLFGLFNIGGILFGGFFKKVKKVFKLSDKK